MRTFPLLITCMLAASVQAQVKTVVGQFRLAGPYAVTSPLLTDSVDVNGEEYDSKSQAEALSLNSSPTTVFTGSIVPSLSDQRSVSVLSFYIDNTDYLEGTIRVKGPKNSKLYVDGKASKGKIELQPDRHTIAVRLLAAPRDTDSIRVTIDSEQAVTYTISEKHPYFFHDLTDGQRVRGVLLSADGRYVLMDLVRTERGGKTVRTRQLCDVATGRVLSERPTGEKALWMPRTPALLASVKEDGKRMLYRIDPQTGVRTLMAADVPEGDIVVSPTEDYLIIYKEEEGPEEDEQVYQVVEPDDRQPGWRDRENLWHYNLQTGVCQRLTFGNQSVGLEHISADGRYLLLNLWQRDLAHQPTSSSTLLRMDVQTLSVDTLIEKEPFLRGARFSPDGKQLLISGSPEAFCRIGCTLPDSVIPNRYEYQLYLFDIATRHVTPLTRDFNPSVERIHWSTADGNIYFTADDRDYVRLYQLNPRTRKIQSVAVKGDNVSQLSLATQVPVVAYLSQEVMAPASAYVLDLKKNAARTLFDGHTLLKNVLLGECRDWNFTNSRGDEVVGRYYLPHDFDPSRRYPLIVYYYGGCMPVSRGFESPYAPQYWNSLGYVAYILQPSGTVGFGQEWAARHVNTWGRGPAEDIIEGVRAFCKTHDYVDSTKIGCMGASYGGFMTQYLQTRTRLFAAAVSHAGISNIASYWGNGFWGYGYSEAATTGNFPWNNPQLYTQQSPLFNADKINTPLLLLHGTDDTNVPLMESHQMFLALKLLGKEVALVEVEGEDHHVLEYSRKHKWVATQMAWFQRWLKGDASWWDALYPKRHL